MERHRCIMSKLYSNPADPVDVAHADGHGDVVIEEKSPGVRRIEAVSSCFTAGHRIVLFVSIFFVACEYTYYCSSDRRCLWVCPLLTAF